MLSFIQYISKLGEKKNHKSQISNLNLERERRHISEAEEPIFKALNPIIDAKIGLLEAPNPK